MGELDKDLIGHLAVSLAGRDCGCLLVATDVCEDGRLLVADGKKRKVENPKRKKKSHLRILSPKIAAAESGALIPGNRALRRAITSLREQVTPDDET